MAKNSIAAPPNEQALSQRDCVATDVGRLAARGKLLQGITHGNLIRQLPLS
jgi:hypothetical protein